MKHPSLIDGIHTCVLAKELIDAVKVGEDIGLFILPANQEATPLWRGRAPNGDVVVKFRVTTHD